MELTLVIVSDQGSDVKGTTVRPVNTQYGNNYKGIKWKTVENVSQEDMLMKHFVTSAYYFFF